jgi:MFS family permease
MTEQAEAPRRGWYYGWTIVAVLMLSNVAGNSLTYNTFALFAPVWSRDLHAPISQFMWCIPAMLIVASPLSPVVGVLADRMPPRRLFAIGLLGMALFYLLVSFATAPWQIVVLYGLVAAPFLLLSTAIPANAVISRWFVRRLGLALGLSSFGIGLGGVVIPPLVAAIQPDVGWRAIWRGGALILAVVVMPLVVWVVRDRPSARDGTYYLTGDDGASRPRAHGPSSAGHGGPTWRDVLTRGQFWILVVVYLSILSTASALNQNMGAIAISHGLSQQQTGYLLAAFSAAHIVATLVTGLLSDRYGARLPMCGLALTVATGVIILAFGQGLPLFVLAAALIGFNSGFMTPLAAGIAAEFGSAGFGRAFGLAMAFLPVGTPLPFLVARAKEATGTYVPVLLAFFVVLIVAAALSLLLRSKEAPRAAPNTNPSLV